MNDIPETIKSESVTQCFKCGQEGRKIPDEERIREWSAKWRGWHKFLGIITGYYFMRRSDEFRDPCDHYECPSCGQRWRTPKPPEPSPWLRQYRSGSKQQTNGPVSFINVRYPYPGTRYLKQYRGLKGFFGIADPVYFEDQDVEWEEDYQGTCSAIIGAPARVKLKNGQIIEGFKDIDVR